MHHTKFSYHSRVSYASAKPSLTFISHIDALLTMSSQKNARHAPVQRREKQSVASKFVDIGITDLNGAKAARENTNTFLAKWTELMSIQSDTELDFNVIMEAYFSHG
jgi:hypothetical protein